jgi:hypothetical protein
LAHFIFPNNFPNNNEFPENLTAQSQEIANISTELFKRLGVKSSGNKFVTMIVVSSDTWVGQIAPLLLHDECEKIYNRRIDLTKMKSFAFENLDAVNKSPYLEHAQFIVVIDKNLLGVKSYPELENILPFHP